MSEDNSFYVILTVLNICVDSTLRFCVMDMDSEEGYVYVYIK